MIFAILVLSLLAMSADAYSGNFAVIPAIAGGPGSNTVTNFDVDTDVSNPQLIDTNLFYVKQVIITTNTGVSGHMLITEEPSRSGGGAAFSFSVPNKVQDELVSAEVYFWGPDAESLSITHSHQGAPDEQIIAYKVSPLETDAFGNVLWVFTTPSFSDFYIGGKKSADRQFIPLFLLAFISLLACAMLRL